jgi:hypothetical protein
MSDDPSTTIEDVQKWIWPALATVPSEVPSSLTP